jgi:orotate phosphoribosyltransferase
MDERPCRRDTATAGVARATGAHLSSPLMRDLRDELIDLTLASGVLCFGRFTLKSGRTSPYFFDLSRCATGRDLVRLAGLYARALCAGFDMLFGPAYKGIPLATALAMALAGEQGRDVPFCFNRKEAKDHGEGGVTFGAPLQGRVVIVDDVLSARTSINASVEIIRETSAEPVACIVALDRMERGARRSVRCGGGTRAPWHHGRQHRDARPCHRPSHLRSGARRRSRRHARLPGGVRGFLTADGGVR